MLLINMATLSVRAMLLARKLAFSKILALITDYLWAISPEHSRESVARQVGKLKGIMMGIAV